MSRIQNGATRHAERIRTNCQRGVQANWSHEIRKTRAFGCRTWGSTGLWYGRWNGAGNDTPLRRSFFCRFCHKRQFFGAFIHVASGNDDRVACRSDELWGFTVSEIRRLKVCRAPPNLDDSSDSNNPDDSPFSRSSTVIRTARSRPNLELLVDDLATRLRCLSPPALNVARTHPLVGLGDEPHLSSIFRETRIWWRSYELGRLDIEGRRDLIEELLQRDPDEAIVAALGLFGSVSFPELNLEDIARMQAWYEQPRLAPRALRDALALRIWATWFCRNPAQVVSEQFEAWLLSSSPGLLRAAFVVAVGLLRESSDSHRAPVLRALECMPAIIGLGESDVESAAGWLLSSLWPIEPSRVEEWVATHGSILSRKVFRIAIGRMPTPIRTRLSAQWKAQRHKQRLIDAMKESQ